MLRFSANLSTLFQDLPLRQRFEAASRNGFEAVELWFPYEIPATEMREILSRHKLTCVGINSPAGNVEQGDWGLAADPARRAEFEASAVQALEYADAIGCTHVHMMAGQKRPDLSFEAAWDNYLHAIATSCDIAGRFGITVMVEPLNRIDRPTYLLSTQAEALELIATLGRANLKLMLDIFHVQRGEGNLIERLRASLPHAGHVQIADNPGRHEPGTGEIAFDRVFQEIEASGYAGHVGCEYFPSGATEASFGWLEARSRR